tara:strand:+ start:38 stop:727 length:690 start_codon:yes stop_codon:yes gene_type:complete
MIHTDIKEILDFTFLKDGATRSEIVNFCIEANKIMPHAVCVFPENAELVKSILDEKIKLALVSRPFPIGSNSVEEIRENISGALALGADEIDCVLEPRESRDFPDELDLEKLVEMRNTCSDTTLKIIIEAPELDERKMRSVIRMVLVSGADYIKSGTGKRGKCTEEQATIIAEEVNRHRVISGEYKGIKLAGGIKNKKELEQLIGAVNRIDRGIAERGLLRIGSSSIIV